jgi:NAD(P) transhydrogenase
MTVALAFLSGTVGMNPDYEFDLVCIGSGPAGQRAAVQAAKLGKRVAVVERRRIVGGVCIDTGTIPSKTFREAIVSVLHSQRAGRNGSFGNNVRPTAEQLLERVGAVVQCEANIIENQLNRNDVQMIRGDAVFKDPHTLTVKCEDGYRDLTAANMLIACGTQPCTPAIAKSLAGKSWATTAAC